MLWINDHSYEWHLVMYENGDHSYELILFIVWYFDHGYEMPLIIGEKIGHSYELHWSCDHGWHIHVIMTVIMTPISLSQFNCMYSSIVIYPQGRCFILSKDEKISMINIIMDFPHLTLTFIKFSLKRGARWLKKMYLTDCAIEQKCILVPGPEDN